MNIPNPFANIPNPFATTDPAKIADDINAKVVDLEKQIETAKTEHTAKLAGLEDQLRKANEELASAQQSVKLGQAGGRKSRRGKKKTMRRRTGRKSTRS
jgi:TolA-binding protein